jgi:hypothetical protein
MTATQPIETEEQPRQFAPPLPNETAQQYWERTHVELQRPGRCSACGRAPCPVCGH